MKGIDIVYTCNIHRLCAKMLRNRMYLAFFLIFQIVSLNEHTVNSSWVPLDPLLDAPLSILASNSQRVELGKNGRRMAVGASDTITVYDLGGQQGHGGKSKLSWMPIAHLSGVSGAHFSLSTNGQYLASRDYLSSKQVDVWEIVDGGQDNDSMLTYRFEKIGTFWCVADGKSVQLGQAGTKLYLAMSCETWQSNRGMVQVFVRDYSPSKNISSTWDDFFPPLEGRNYGDQFGAALSITEASSHRSKYEFRLAVGAPGYSDNRGLVLVYTASYTLSNGWKQMGNDLMGAKVGEHFGASLDTSANINEQLFLVVGSPGWKEIVGILDNESDIRGNETNSKGTGLVRLYHWRRPASAFRSPRRWALVGNPMSGRKSGEQFGNTVVISRTGERIAVAALSPTHEINSSSDVDEHQLGYVGVYERDSYDTWGKVVNEIIYSGENYKCLAINDQGSMVFTTISDGTVEGFLDDSPFCDVFPIESLHPSINETFYIDSLLNRQTCRKSDTLIEDKSSCLQQSAYMNGGFQACSWNNISITNTLSMAPSTFPTTNPTSTAPSNIPSIAPLTTSLSFSPSDAVFDNPSNLPQSFISSEPSDFSEFLMIDSLGPSQPTSNDLTEKPIWPPATSSNDIDHSVSTQPTQTSEKKFFVSGTSPEPSSSPITDISLSPTDLAPSKTDREVGQATVRSCQCDASNVCTDQTLSQGHAKLRICVFLGLESFKKTEVSIDDANIRQNDVFLPIMENGNPIFGDGDTQYKCEDHSWPLFSTCKFEISLTPILLRINDSSNLFVEGTISVVEAPEGYANSGFRLRKSENQKIRFSVAIQFVESNNYPTVSPTNPATTATTNEEELSKEMRIGGLVALLFVLMIVVVYVWYQKKICC